MQKTRCLTMFIVVCALLVFAAGAVPIPAGAQDLAEFEKRITEFTLENGMKFLVLQRHEAPVASFFTYADVGGVDEAKGVTGIAHLLEHMAFKGTKKIGTSNYYAEVLALARVDAAYHALSRERLKGKKTDQKLLGKLGKRFREAQEKAAGYVISNEFPQVLNRAGSDFLNAGTSLDSTIYMVSLPSNKAELWMSTESDRFLNPVFREFYKELEVVKEERRMRVDSRPQGRLIEEFLAAAFKAHSYGDAGIGHMSDLEAMTREKVETFFKHYYTPANLTGIIVGDVDPGEIKRLAELYFGRLPAGPKPEQVITVEPAQLGERRVILKEKSQPSLMIGYHIPGINHSDWPVFQVLNDILSSGRTSRLYKTMVKERKIAAGLWSSVGFPGRKYPALLVVSVQPASGHTGRECEEVVYEQLERLKTEPVTDRELKKAVTRARASVIRRLGSNLGLGFALSAAEVLTGDWRYFFIQLEQMKNVTAADIQRVTGEYFTVSNRTVGLIETTGEADGGEGRP